MAEMADLIAAITGKSAEQGARILAAAARRGVEPLEFCAHRFGLDAASVWERAAEWANLAFFPSIGPGILISEPPTRLDALAEIRTGRGRIFDRDIVFVAPAADHFVTLATSIRERPHLRATIAVTTPAALRAALLERHSAQLLDESRQRLVRRWPRSACSTDLPLPVRIIFVGLLLAIVAMALVSPYFATPLLFPPIALLLAAPGALRLFASIPGLVPEPLSVPDLLGDDDLPVYSVLLPLRNEVQMVPTLANAMRALDYPPEKLDIKFVVEARSQATVAAVSLLLDDPRFELVAVPDERPRTKPKAINYALPFVRGDYVVVFDAEDIPEPQQLRKAATLFARYPEYDCLQAELAIDNASENWLTAMFAGEYAGQFGLMLPALSYWRLPMPLGGTSNHFSTRALRELGGWDAYNVTEDADLGVRLARLRYRAATFASHTGEEAPIHLRAWMAQRTRWMKGWMQTFIVHSRYPAAFIRDAGWRSFLAFEVYVGGLIISALLHTLFLAVLAGRVALGLPLLEGRFDGWTAACLATLIVGYGGALVLMTAGVLRVGKAHLLPLLPTLPVYWLLHSWATLRAAHELLVRPFFWAKTEHGRTRVSRSLLASSPEPVIVKR